MRLDAPERRELILAMQDGFNLPQRLGDFLRDNFDRNLAIIEAECPNTIGLYDYVVRVFEGEGLLLELLRRACETLQPWRTQQTGRLEVRSAHYRKRAAVEREGIWIYPKPVADHGLKDFICGRDANQKTCNRSAG